MVKSAKDGLSGDLVAPLDRPMARRIFIQRQMRSELVVIGSVVSKDPAQVTFAKDVKASNLDVVEIRLAGHALILGTKEPRLTDTDWQALATARDKTDAWLHYAEAACHSTQLRTYMSKGFSVVFRLYDATGNLRVTYAPVNIGACRNI